MCDNAHTLLMTDDNLGTEPERDRPDATVSAKFAGLARRDTSPEVALRRVLHAQGLRYRVDQRIPGLPRKRVDIVFSRRRLAVFVDGCFWHGCPVHFKQPKRNPEWWVWKIQNNRRRDAETNDRLASLGWQVIRVWEHEDTKSAAQRVLDAWQGSNQ